MRQFTFVCEHRERLLPIGWRSGQLSWNVVGATAVERRLDREQHAVSVQRLAVNQQDEVDQILYPRIGPSFAGARVGVELLGPMLLGAESGDDDGCDTPNPSQSLPTTWSRGSSTSSPAPRST